MAGLTRWDPFSDIARLHEQVNRIFDERWNGWDRWLARANGPTPLADFSPPVDVYEDAEGITLTAEIPGVAPEDVEVKVEDDTLTISGKRSLEREDKRDNYHRIERRYGTFLRSFTLPPSVDAERIRAENRHGVLSVFLPRKEEARPRKITVKVH